MHKIILCVQSGSVLRKKLVESYFARSCCPSPGQLLKDGRRALIMLTFDAMFDSEAELPLTSLALRVRSSEARAILARSVDFTVAASCFFRCSSPLL